MTYEFWKDFAGPIATGSAAFVAAGVTATFAYRQWKTAQQQAEIALDKLKHDTFAARNDVLDATRDLIKWTFSGDPYNKQTDLAETYIDRMEVGRFFFGEHVQGELNKTARYCLRYNDLRKRKAVGILRDESEMAKIFVIIERRLKDLPSLFEFDLSLNLLKDSSDRYYSVSEHHSQFDSAHAAMLAIIGAFITVLIFAFTL